MNAIDAVLDDDVSSQDRLSSTEDSAPEPPAPPTPPSLVDETEPPFDSPVADDPSYSDNQTEAPSEDINDNYPVKPGKEDYIYVQDIIISIKYVIGCGITKFFCERL